MLSRGARGAGSVLAILAAVVLAPSAASAAEPNISYAGGPVLHSSAPYLVFWTPRGESIPAGSRSLLRRYLTDVAADSGKSTNEFGVLRQYYDRTGFADYRQRFDARRQVIVDRQPYPAEDPVGCPDVTTAYRRCISLAQVEAELRRLVVDDRLPTAAAIANFSSTGFAAHAADYLMVLPADVASCTPLAGGMATVACSGKDMCAYHTWSLDSTHQHVLVFGVVPMRSLRDGAVFPNPKGNCQHDRTKVTQEPNGNAADVVLSLVSHEVGEMITDPINNINGWFNSSSGNEVGDNCNVTGSFDPATILGQVSNPAAFLPTLGGSRRRGTLYDELINGHHYYTQSNWSNGAHGCEMRPSGGRIIPRFTVPARPARAGAMLRFNPARSTSKHGFSSGTWRFGDGSPTAFYSGSAALTPATHAYRRAGRYTVTLTLVDVRGNLTNTSHQVVVHRQRGRHSTVLQGAEKLGVRGSSARLYSYPLPQDRSAP